MNSATTADAATQTKPQTRTPAMNPYNSPHTRASQGLCYVARLGGLRLRT